MGDFLSAFRVFLAPGLTLTYHRLKSAKSPEREPWRRAGSAPRAQRQLHSQGSVRGAPQPPQFAAAADLARIIEESAASQRARVGQSRTPPAIPLACGGTCEHPALAPHRLGVPELPMQPSNTSGRALCGHTRCRRFGARIGGSAVERSKKSNFSKSIYKQITTKPRVIPPTTVPTTLPGVLHALGIVRYLHNQNEISKLGGWPPAGGDRARLKFSESG